MSFWREGNHRLKIDRSIIVLNQRHRNNSGSSCAQAEERELFGQVKEGQEKNTAALIKGKEGRERIFSTKRDRENNLG